jgi:hypothetical protein
MGSRGTLVSWQPRAAIGGQLGTIFGATSPAPGLRAFRSATASPACSRAKRWCYCRASVLPAARRPCDQSGSIWPVRNWCPPKPAGAFLLLVEQLEIEIECPRYIKELRWIRNDNPQLSPLLLALGYQDADGSGSRFRRGPPAFSTEGPPAVAACRASGRSGSLFATRRLVHTGRSGAPAGPLGSTVTDTLIKYRYSLPHWPGTGCGWLGGGVYRCMPVLFPTRGRLSALHARDR